MYIKATSLYPLVEIIVDNAHNLFSQPGLFNIIDFNLTYYSHYVVSHPKYFPRATATTELLVLERIHLNISC